MNIYFMRFRYSLFGPDGNLTDSMIFDTPDPARLTMEKLKKVAREHLLEKYSKSSMASEATASPMVSEILTLNKL